MSIIERWFPIWALNRATARRRLENMRLFDAAKTTHHRTKPRGNQSADGVNNHGAESLRQWARHLDENHDLAIGILDDLVNNTVGNGITTHSMLRNRSGELHTEANEMLDAEWKKYTKRPEITGELPDVQTQRLAARSLFRDGEIFIRHIRSNRVQYAHESQAPYAIELIEADYCPFSPITGQNNVIHGVKKGAFNRPVSYLFYKSHPGDTFTHLNLYSDDLTEVPASDIMHLKFMRRVQQTRGVSIFHGIITRLADLKDYEESERIAARISADFTGYIKRGPNAAQPALDTTNGRRELQMQAGMILDELGPDEEIGLIKSDRPNTNLGDFRADQMRAIAAGTGSRYSTISRRFDNSYSAQRQETAESATAYSALQGYFQETFLEPRRREWLRMLLTAGFKLPPGVDQKTLFEIEFRAKGMPWIDPLKEVKADVEAVNAGFTSRQQVQRKFGDPALIQKQIAEEKEGGLYEPQQENPQPGDDEAGSDDDNDDGNGNDAGNDDGGEAAQSDG